MSIEVLLRELIDSINTLNENIKTTTSSANVEAKADDVVEKPKTKLTSVKKPKKSTTPEVDYDKLRQDVREIAATKAEVDRVAVKKAIGSVQDGVDKLADISNDYLQILKDNLEAL